MTAPIQHPTDRSDPGAEAAPATAYLRFVGLSEDGTRLRLVDEEGAEHVLAVDDRLRAAVVPTNPTAPPGNRGTEKTMESTLRPRDIQARIRSGETPEAVAQAAQTSVDKIMAFAAPVLAERQHVAERAQRSSVRRSDTGQATGARTLGDAVAAQLRSHNIDPQTVEWDAWRREDGRWSLIAGYDTPERSGAAELTFDAPGNYVTLDNEDARWLVGIAIAAPETPARPDDLQAARQRRLGSTGDPAYDDAELPLGGSALGGSDLGGSDLGDDAIDLVTDQPIDAFLDIEPPTDDTVLAEEAELREEAADAAATEPEPEVRRPAKKRGRASVPSWDEIMFGGSNGPDRG